MKKIILKKLTLENWRAQNVSLNFSDGVNEVRAKNGIGKSTLFNAWVWLICGTDTQDRANYDLYNTKETLSKDTPSAIVEAELVVDGVPLTLKRCAKSQWTRPRGKEEWVKASSDKYTFFVDNVEYQAKAYQDVVSGLFAGQDADMIKMMTNPSQSLNLDWKQLRKMFQRIIGEIKESDYEGDYSLIEDSIRTHGFDIAKQAVLNRVNVLKNSLKTIEADLKAKERTLPDLSQCEEALKQISEKKARITELDAEITGIGATNMPFIEKRTQEQLAITDKQDEIAAAKKAHESQCEEKVRSARENYQKAILQAREIEDFNSSLSSRKSALEKDIISAKADVEFLTESRKDLLKQKEEAKSRQFVYNDICPTCGQQIPLDEAKISAARLAFNAAKETEVKEIVKKGQATRARLDEREARLAELEAKRNTFVEKEQIDIAPYEKALADVKATIVAFESTEQYTTLKNELEFLENNRTEIPETQDTLELQVEKDTLLSQIQTLTEITAYRRIHEQISKDIANKKVEQKATASELAAEEHKLFKFVEYEREHASIISCRVNKYLKIANVKMLSVNKSGEYTDCCVITCDTVGNTMNRASVIRTGVDVANAFQRYFELSAPIFVDDVDCIADELIPYTDSQQIRLRFDKSYEQLTLVY
jgi:hypothetical protein